MTNVIDHEVMKTHVRVIPSLFAEMKRRNVFLAYRDLLIVQALDERNEGQVRYPDAVDGIVAMGKHPKTARRMISRAIDAGMIRPVYVPHLDVTYLKFVGRPKLLERFGCAKTTQIVELPVSLLLDAAWYRHLEGAAIAALARRADETPRPIARITRKRLHGSSAQTQRRAEKVAKIRVRRCWVAKPLEPGDCVDEPGTKTMHGVKYTRVGNSYQQSVDSPYRVIRKQIYASSWKITDRENFLRRRVVDTYETAVALKPRARQWGWPQAHPIRGGHERLYITHQTTDAVIYSPVTTLKEDWLKITGFVPPRRASSRPKHVRVVAPNQGRP